MLKHTRQERWGWWQVLFLNVEHLFIATKTHAQCPHVLFERVAFSDELSARSTASQEWHSEVRSDQRGLLGIRLTWALCIYFVQAEPSFFRVPSRTPRPSEREKTRQPSEREKTRQPAFTVLVMCRRTLACREAHRMHAFRDGSSSRADAILSTIGDSAWPVDWRNWITAAPCTAALGTLLLCAAQNTGLRQVHCEYLRLSREACCGSS